MIYDAKCGMISPGLDLGIDELVHIRGMLFFNGVNIKVANEQHLNGRCNCFRVLALKPFCHRRLRVEGP